MLKVSKQEYGRSRRGWGKGICRSSGILCLFKKQKRSEFWFCMEPRKLRNAFCLLSGETGCSTVFMSQKQNKRKSHGLGCRQNMNKNSSGEPYVSN